MEPNHGLHMVVTGSTKGIGKAICDIFAPFCHCLYINSRNEDELSQQAESLTKLNPDLTVVYSRADFSNPDEVSNFAQLILSKTNRIDILVNNAGIFYPGSVVGEADGNLRKMTEVNLFSAYDLTRMLLPALRTSHCPHIFNMCSIASIIAYPNGGSYSITKFALYGMTKCLRAELIPEKIKVTAILPGATWSDSWTGIDLPEERLMQADDIAKSIFYAASLSPSANVEEILIRPIEGDL